MNRPRPRAPTQGQRLLAWARKGNPLDQRDWFAAGADGGPPITAVRSRVSNLEAQGYRFRHVLRRGRLAQYWLVCEPCDEPPRAAGDVEVDDQLELPSPVIPRSAIFGDDWDA